MAKKDVSTLFQPWQILTEKPLTDFNPATGHGQINLSQLCHALAAASRNQQLSKFANEVAGYINEQTLRLIQARTGRPRKDPQGNPAKAYIVECDNCRPVLALTVQAVAKLVERAPQSIYNSLSQKGKAGAWVYFLTTDENGNPASHRVRYATEAEIAAGKKTARPMQ